jgi:hypothetical protein
MADIKPMPEPLLALWSFFTILESPDLRFDIFAWKYIKLQNNEIQFLKLDQVKIQQYCLFEVER